MSTAAIAWSGLTHRGRFRPNNEDAFIALRADGRQIQHLGTTGRTNLDTADCLFAVSDGMGGAQSGEFASRFAIDRIASLVPRAFRLSAGGLQSGFQDILTELFGRIHDDLLQLEASYEECAGMGATLSLAWFRPEWMYFAHVGDSRIYYLPAAGAPDAAPSPGLRQLTEDHTHVGWLRRTGQINEREARNHPRRNALDQTLGAGHQFLEPQIGAIGWRPRDRFLLCTDGVVDGLWDRRLGEVLQSAAPAGEIAGILVHEAVEASGRDNATAVAVEMLPAPAGSDSLP
ncbi:MAG: PP2C family protein-serine/threonine phosphatase [Opitutaceae bacterium]